MNELQKIRQEKKVSVYRIAKDTELTIYKINRIEKGGNVGFHFVKIYCDYLGIKILFVK